MSNIIELMSNPLLGKWQSSDGMSDLEFTVSSSGGQVVVSGLDKGDGEVLSISSVNWDTSAQVLSFDSYCESTGQLTKYRFSPAPRTGRALVTYTFTAQDTWEKC